MYLKRQASSVKRSKVRRTLGTLGMVAAGIIAFASPALAATFTQNDISFTNSWESENPNSNSAGTHSVTATMACNTANTPTVEVYQDFWLRPNTPLGRKNLACESTRTATWHSNNSGDHFLVFRYPGAALIRSFSWTYPY